MLRFFDYIIYIFYVASVNGKSAWTSGPMANSQGDSARGLFAFIVSTLLILLLLDFSFQYKFTDKVLSYFSITDGTGYVFFIFIIVWFLLFIVLWRHYNDAKIKEINTRYSGKVTLFQARVIYWSIFFAIFILFPGIFILGIGV